MKDILSIVFDLVTEIMVEKVYIMLSRNPYQYTGNFVHLRVQCHSHACIFGWLLGDCISETTADIPRNQRPTLQDWRRLYTLQTMSAESARRKRDGRG